MTSSPSEFIGVTFDRVGDPPECAMCTSRGHWTADCPHLHVATCALCGHIYHGGRPCSTCRCMHTLTQQPRARQRLEVFTLSARITGLGIVLCAQRFRKAIARIIRHVFSEMKGREEEL